MVREENYDVVIVGCGVGGLYTALNLPSEDRILMICKEDIESCDSMLAQGGICVLHDENDYDSYFEDTMRAGHYENRKESVDLMIRGSRSSMICFPSGFVLRRIRTARLPTREREHIPDRESVSMRISPARRSPRRCFRM